MLMLICCLFIFLIQLSDYSDYPSIRSNLGKIALVFSAEIKNCSRFTRAIYY